MTPETCIRNKTETVIFITSIQITMKKIVLILFALAILAAPSAAQVTVSYKIGLNRILPGDVVDCSLVITNPNDYTENIKSVVFYSDLVSPKLVLGIGLIPPKSEYTLPFSFSADKPGTYTVKVRVATPNGSVDMYIPFAVVEDYPKLRLENSEIVLGQKNVLKVYVDWYENVTIRPLFNATPSESYGKSFEFIYYPSKKENLEFEIEFRNGNNVHVIKRAVEVSWVEEKGVPINITGVSNAYRNEAVEMDIVVTNLNSYRIEDVELKTGDIVRKTAYLDPGKSWDVRLYVPAEKKIDVFLSYSNQLGKRYKEEEVAKLNIINESAVQVCSYEFDKGLLSGEICNFGSTEVKNVVVEFGGEKYFVGTVMPGDYEVFSIKTNKTQGSIEVSWKNLAGKIESISQEIKGMEIKTVKREAGNGVLIMSAAIALIVVIIAVLALRRK